MEIDTGAAVTLISATTYKTMWGPSPPLLRESTTILRAYGGRIIKVLGTLKAKVQGVDRAPSKQLELYVVKGNGPSLLGRDSLRHIQVDWKALFRLSTHSSLEELLEENREVFQDDLGELKGIQATLNAKSQATPRFYKARKVPIH